MPSSSPPVDLIPRPCAQPRPLQNKMSLQPPLSRRGSGPGLVVILPPRLSMRPHVTLGLRPPLDPDPVKKWAEEGYTVVGLHITGDTDVTEVLLAAVEGLDEAPETEQPGRYAVLVYDPSALPSVVAGLGALPQFVSIVSYGAAAGAEVPVLAHVPNRVRVRSCSNGSPCALNHCKVHEYSVESVYFAIPSAGPKAYSPTDAGVAHTRSLKFLREHLRGPYFDLEAIWDEHCLYEFGERSVENTMATMVDEPYVNHVPTMTGGIGRKALTEFYRDHFIFSNPDDVELVNISRTVGIDRVVDEFIFRCTHDREIDWLLPGVPPSGKQIEVPMLGVINFRGDRLYHEHIWWDQASVLQQTGYLPEFVPCKDGLLRLPIAADMSAKMLEDETSGTANFMLGSGWGIRPVANGASSQNGNGNSHPGPLEGISNLVIE